MDVREKFREKLNKSYIARIERDSYLSTFVKEMKPMREITSEITQNDIDVLHCYMHGVSISTIVSKYNITNIEYEVYRILYRVLNAFAKSGYRGSLVCLELPNRIQNALLRGGVYSVSQVEEYFDKGNISTSIRGIGKGSVEIIKESLDKYKTNLKLDAPIEEVSKYTTLLNSKTKDEAINVLLDVLKEKGEYDLVEAYNKLYS